LLRGQSHLAEAIVFVDVGTGDPDDETGGKSAECGREGAGEGGEVVVARNLAGQSDVEVAGFFGAGVISFAVDRVGEDAPVTAEDGMGAVALVRIGVGDENAKARLPLVQVADGDSDIIEHAIAEAAFGKSVMRAAGQVGGHAMGKGVMAGGDGGGGFEGGTVEQARLPGESKLVDLRVVERAVGQFEEIVAGVDAEELAVRSRCDRADLDGRIFRDEQVVGLRKFFHGEWMSGRKRKKEIRMIKAAQARRHGGEDARRGLARQTI